MKKQWKWLLSALALVAVLAIAALLYRNLSERFAAGTTTASSAETEAETAAAAETLSAAQTDVSGDSREESSAMNEPEAPQEKAADFVVFDENNAQVRLSEHFGNPLVVNFWVSWCGPCCMELPVFDAAAKQYAGEVEFMMVNLTDGYSETVSSAKEFLAENGYTFPVYYDCNGDATNAYHIQPIPMTVFIRADGTVLDSHIGAMNEAILQDYLAQLTA